MLITVLFFRNSINSEIQSSSKKKDTSSKDATYFEGKTGAQFESVYRRKNEKELADRIALFRKKQEKKREKIQKILAKREAKKASGILHEEPEEVQSF